MTEQKVSPPQRIVLLDIDGLRQDVWQQALAEGKIPNLARLVGGDKISQGIQFRAISTAPSVTFCCQASTITGAHPRDHWIAGNMFFDRFGRINNGKPRKYEFDFLDAHKVFSQGLASQAIHPDVETLYQTAQKHGLTSTVVFQMYAGGAQHWLKPGLEDWKTFVAIHKPDFGERYDRLMLNEAIDHLNAGHRPAFLMLYFFGLDHESHLHGPEVQREYLSRVLDPQIGEFIQFYQTLGLMPETLFCIFSDHGHIKIVNDDIHALKVGFVFDREYGYVFQALDLDVNDHPLEGANCDALLTQAGGMALVYLKRATGNWQDPPRFQEDTLRVAQAFWDSNKSGKYSQELKGALEMIMVRNVEHSGWYAPYQIFTPQGLLPLEVYQVQHPELNLVDAANRLHYLSSPVSGDILLFANAAEGFSFTVLPYQGMHGGLHPEDSTTVLAYCLPEGSPEEVTALQEMLTSSITTRCRAEGNRQVSNVDVAFGLRKVMGWV